MLELSASDIEIVDDEAEIADLDDGIHTRFAELRDSYLEEVKKLPSDDNARQAALLFEVGRLEEELLDDPEAAFLHYRESYKRLPGVAVNLRALRRLYLQRNQLKDVIRTIDDEARVAPDPGGRAALFYEKGLIELQPLRDGPAAEASFKQALDLDSRFLPALVMLADIADGKKDHKTRSSILVRMAQASEDDERKGLYMAEVGVIAEAANKPTEALDRYRAAIGHNAQHVGARFSLERLYTARGEWGLLMDLLLQNAERASDSTVGAAHRYLAGVVAAYRLGEDARAAVLQEQAFHGQKDRGLALDELGEIYARQGKLPELVRTLERQLARGEGRSSMREQAALLFQIGQINERLGQPDASVERYVESLLQVPGYVSSRRALIRLLDASGADEQVALLLRAEADTEGDVLGRYDILIQLAEHTERRLGELDAAIEIYQEAHRLAPGKGPAFRALDRLFGARKEWTRLAQLLKEEADKTSDQSRRAAILKRAAYIFESHLDQPEAASALLEELVEGPPSQRDITLALSRVYAEQGRYADWVENLEREAGLANSPEERLTLLCHAAEVAEAHLADTGRAKTLYLKVLEKQPDHLRALRNLARIYQAAGHWNDLVDIYKKELAATPEGASKADFAYQLGLLQEERLGEDGAAEQSYREALKQEEAYVPALDALLRLLVRRKRWNDVLVFLETRAQAASTPGRRGEILLRAAQITFHHMEDIKRSLERCRKAMQADPTLVAAHLFNERVSAASGRFDELSRSLAKSLADEDLPVETRISDGLKLTAIRRVHLPDVKAAAEAAQTVLELDPRNAEALFSLLTTLRAAADDEGLRDVLRRLAEATGDPVTASADLIQLASTLPPGESYDAVRAEVFDRVLAINPNDPYALPSRERLARNAGDFATLGELLRRTAQIASDATTRTAAYMSLGDLSWRAEALDDAARWYSLAVQEYPTWLPGVRALRTLREVQGRRSEAAELLEREAELSVDDDTRIEALMRAADIWLQDTKDVQRAEHLYAKVFSERPSDAVAFQQLAALVEARQAYGDLVRTYRQHIAKLEGADRIRLLFELADIYENKLRRPADAVVPLEEALEIDGQHQGALARVAQLYRALERWRDAALALEKLSKVQKDAGQRRVTLFARAEVLEKELGEDAAALKAIERVLDTSPNDRDALAAAVRLYRRLGNWEGTVRVLTHLAEGAPPADRVQALLELAQITERGLNQPEAASRHVAQAAALCSLAPESVGHLERYFLERDDAEGLDHTLERVLEKSRTPSPGLTAMRLAKAKNLVRQLGRDDEAEQEARRVLAEEPDSPGAALVLGELHLRRHDPGLAQVEYHAVLNRDPFHPDAYRGLMAVHEVRGEPHRVALTAHALIALEVADSDERAAAEGLLAPLPLPQAGQPLGLSGYLHFLAAKDEPAAARALLQAITPFLHKELQQNVSQWGVEKLVLLNDTHPLRRRALQVAELLGCEDSFEIHLSEKQPDIFVLEPGRVSTILVGRNIYQTGGKPLDFHLGRALGRLLTQTQYLQTTKLPELELVLAGVTAQFEKDYGLHLGGDAVAGRGKSFTKKIPRRSRKLLEEPARAYASANPTEMTEWLTAVEQGTARCGLLASADLESAVTVLRGENASSQTIGAFIAFAIGPRYVEARRFVGLGL